MNSTSTEKFKVFLDFKKSIRGVKLPVNINYLNLVWYIKEKYGIQDKSISLHYMSGSNTVDVCDDDDVDFFVTEICCKQKSVQTLFVTVVNQTLEVIPSSYRKTLDIDLNVPLLNEEFIYETPKVSNNHSPIVNNNDSPIVNNNHFDPEYENTDNDVQHHWQRFTFKNMPKIINPPNPIVKKK